MPVYLSYILYEMAIFVQDEQELWVSHSGNTSPPFRKEKDVSGDEKS